jgi:hypothetical protein
MAEGKEKNKKQWSKKILRRKCKIAQHEYNTFVNYHAWIAGFQK